MTLGSPSSPSAANTSNYLPSYLMGEPNTMTAPRTNTLSPTKGRTLAFGKYGFFLKESSRTKQIMYVFYVQPLHHQPHQFVHQTILIDQSYNNEVCLAQIIKPLHHIIITQMHNQ